MSTILMSGCYDFFLIKWIANLLGYIMSFLYDFFGMMGIYNIGICIIVFTIITKLLIFPLAVKQQKWTKVSSVMSPELQAIQKKYANKRDADSMQRQQREMNAVYEKYGTSPTGSCWPMLIQMLILFALYAIIISIPTYVKPISEIYDNMSTKVEQGFEILDSIENVDKLVNGEDKSFSDLIDRNYDSDKDSSENKKKIYDNLINLYASVKPAEDFDSAYEMAKEKINALILVTDTKWDELIKASTNDKNTEILNKYKGYTDTDWNNLLNSLSILVNNEDEEINSIEEYSNQISEIYTLAKINLSLSPQASMDAGAMIALLIPILSFLSQWLSMKISQSSSGQQLQDNPMASSMKFMLYSMPVLSAWFCYTLPAGLGLYWIMSAVVQTGTTLIINHKYKDMDVQDIINENVEKMKKKRERLGVSPEDNRISNVANYNAKNIKSHTSYTNTTSDDYKEVNDYFSSLENNVNEDKDIKLNGKTYKKGSIAERANMVKQYNEKNSKK